MAVDPKQLADRLGLELRDAPVESERWPIANVRVEVFKKGDPAFSMVALDGELIPRRIPVEPFRKKLAKDGGVFILPDGNTPTQSPSPSTSRTAKILRQPGDHSAQAS